MSALEDAMFGERSPCQCGQVQVGAFGGQHTRHQDGSWTQHNARACTWTPKGQALGIEVETTMGQAPAQPSTLGTDAPPRFLVGSPSPLRTHVPEPTPRPLERIAVLAAVVVVATLLVCLALPRVMG